MSQPVTASHARETKEIFARAAPRIAEDVIALAHQSNDIELKLKVLDKATKLNGWDPRPDANASLTTVNWTINFNGISAEPVTVDVAPVEKPAESMLLPEGQEAVQPAPAAPALVLQIGPLLDALDDA